MKNIILFSVAVIALATSCKKERSCECVIKSTTVQTHKTSGVVITSTNDDTTTDTFEKISKKDLRRNKGCVSSTRKSSNTSNPTYTYDYTTDETCTIK